MQSAYPWHCVHPKMSSYLTWDFCVIDINCTVCFFWYTVLLYKWIIFPQSALCMYVGWLVGVVVRALDSWSRGRGFDSDRGTIRATTLPPWASCSHLMCLCSPSSITWYLARAFMLMRRNVAAGIGPMNKGSIVERLCGDLDRKEPRYKCATFN